MRTTFLVLLLALECVAVTPVLAQTSSTAKSPTKIETTVEMRESASKDLKAADAMLNQVYSQLLSKIQDSNQKAKLRTAQRAWLKYRDTQAQFEASFYSGGSIQPQIFTTCLAATTKKRVQELLSVLNTEFGQ